MSQYITAGDTFFVIDTYRYLFLSHRYQRINLDFKFYGNADTPISRQCYEKLLH
jgi:hypothetical protein